MSKFKRIDISKVRTIRFKDRDTKTDVQRFARPFQPDLPFSDFLLSLPDYLRAGDLLSLAREIAEARSKGRTIVWMMGAHPLKVGLSPVINDLIQNGYVSHLAVSGAFAIHDVEIAFFGRTSEEVVDGLSDGTFGMVEETPGFIFEAAAKAAEDDMGLGEGLGMFIMKRSPEFAAHSVLHTCYVNDVPASVHMAIGTDTISQHAGFDGGLFGRLSADDFRLLCDSVSRLSNGVIVNFGSAVILPEVFLKALTVARNIAGSVKDFSAANFDMIQHYRPNRNVISRPVAVGGKGYSITGHHELMLPLLAAAIKSQDMESAGR
jgi:hypothetical protein